MKGEPTENKRNTTMYLWNRRYCPKCEMSFRRIRVKAKRTMKITITTPQCPNGCGALVMMPVKLKVKK